MSSGISLALLLLSATVVRSQMSLDIQNAEEDFPLQLKHDVKERADHHTEEGAFPGSCPACEYIVPIVKKKLGNDNSKAKIRDELNKICKSIKNIFKSVCKVITKSFEDILIDALSKKESPRNICVQIKLCKKS
uniref:prosaposin-like n=1 Tax=Scatophagus argus TaxID=75038 RepID=UPI001ED83C01|nr:prosaposin-like [Scatophagus argus]